MLYKQTNDTLGKAVFSDDMTRRYLLSRHSNTLPKKIIHFVMLNPSIGDHEILETTTKGVWKRALSWGYEGMSITNMFSLISTDPKGISKEPISELLNDQINTMMLGEITVCAWGRAGLRGQKHMLEVLKGKELYTLGLNKDGTPRHPLHMSHAIKPQPWLI